MPSERGMLEMPSEERLLGSPVRERDPGDPSARAAASQRTRAHYYLSMESLFRRLSVHREDPEIFKALNAIDGKCISFLRCQRFLI